MYIVHTTTLSTVKQNNKTFFLYLQNLNINRHNTSFYNSFYGIQLNSLAMRFCINYGLYSVMNETIT